ncbi:MAG: class I SAM-dependent methyltransferase [Hyphomicrobiales bacterium]
MTKVGDRWAAGSAYEDFMGRWSRPLAARFVAWLGIPGSAHWLDVGCGTGALTSAICDAADPASVVGCDPAEPLIDFAREQVRDDRVSFVVAGVGSLPSRPGGYGSIASLLALNFFPDPPASVEEMRGIASPDGGVSACVWDYAGKMEFLRHFWDAASASDPGARDLDEGVRFPLCHPEALVDLFRAGGLRDVRCEPIEIETEFAGFEDYWRPLLGGTGPAPSYVASLDEPRRDALKQALERKLASSPGGRGAISLTARAWAVTSRR